MLQKYSLYYASFIYIQLSINTDQILEKIKILYFLLYKDIPK